MAPGTRQERGAPVSAPWEPVASPRGTLKPHYASRCIPGEVVLGICRMGLTNWQNHLQESPPGAQGGGWAGGLLGMVRLPGEGDPVSVMQALNLSGVMLSHCPYGPCSSSGRCSELGVVGRWAWHRAGSRPGAHHPPRGASSELCHPHQEGSLQALGGRRWDLGAQWEGTYGCQGHRLGC